MNKERLLRAASILREHGVPFHNGTGFRMSCYQNNCGSPACVLGHVAHYDKEAPFGIKEGFLFDRKTGYMIDFDHPLIADYFDVSHRVACRLFAPDGCDGAGCDPIQAAGYIERIVRCEP